MIKKAVIPAAGFGTRFLPATKSQPKEMLPIIDKPVIQYVVEEAVASGITDILIVTGRGKQAIENHFDRSFELELELERAGKRRQLHEVKRLASLARIHYIRQSELLGIGHAVFQAKEHVGDEPFVVLLGDTIIDADIPCTRRLIDAWSLVAAPVVGVEHVPKERVERFGVVRCGEEIHPGISRVEEVVEKPLRYRAPSDLALVGRYVFGPDLFEVLEEPVKRAEKEGGRVELSDILDTVCRGSNLFARLIEGRRYDIGERKDFVEAVLGLGLKRPDLSSDIRDLLSRMSDAGPEKQ